MGKSYRPYLPDQDFLQPLSLRDGCPRIIRSTSSPMRRFTLPGNSSSRFRLADTMPKLADLGIARNSWAIVTVPGALRRDEDVTILQCIKASFLPRPGDGL